MHCAVLSSPTANRPERFYDLNFVTNLLTRRTWNTIDTLSLPGTYIALLVLLKGTNSTLCPPS